MHIYIYVYSVHILEDGRTRMLTRRVARTRDAGKHAEGVKGPRMRRMWDY